jgi:replicative DNA helicase
MEKKQHQMRGISTGFHDIDLVTKGLCEGNLILVAGRPPMKTIVLAMNIAEHAALTDKLPVAVFLMEKDAGQVTSRLLTKTESINHDDQSSEACDDKSTQSDSLSGFLNHSGPNSLYLQEIPDLSVSQLRTNLQLLYKRCGRLGLIVLDSLQLIGHNTSSNEQGNPPDLCGLVYDLKLIAVEFNCPVLVLSDLPEKIDSRTYKRPKMKDLRTWGDIDQIADVIFFLYRDDFYNKNSFDPGIAEITFIKNINGFVGGVRLAFLNFPNQHFISLHSESDDY